MLIYFSEVLLRKPFMPVFAESGSQVRGDQRWNRLHKTEKNGSFRTLSGTYPGKNATCGAPADARK
jgi:hypothetical protein